MGPRLTLEQAEATRLRQNARCREYAKTHKRKPRSSEQTRYYNKLYRTRHRERSLANGRRYNRQMKTAIITKYGGACACCNESRIEFLSLDHIGGRGAGAAHRRSFKHTRAVYRDVLNGPTDNTKYQILCMNCNTSYGFHGYCPHKEQRPWL